jgi:hypothetical protein
MPLTASESINLTDHNWLKYVRKKCDNYAERETEMDCKFTHSWRFQSQGRKK